jgi:hypothetical protein
VAMIGHRSVLLVTFELPSGLDDVEPATRCYPSYTSASRTASGHYSIHSWTFLSLPGPTKGDARRRRPWPAEDVVRLVQG